MPRFTDRQLKAVKKPAEGERPTELWDEDVRGLGFRVGHTGTRTFHVMTRVNGRQIRHVIGPYPATTLKDAREDAGQVIRDARKGINPREEKRRAQREAERARRDTVRAIADEFIERYSKPRNRSWGETARIFSVYVHPTWGERAISEISRRDVIELLDQIAKEHGPIMSNRTLAQIRRLFTWAIERDMIDSAPTANVKPVGKETSRDRVLSDRELRAFWVATETLGAPWSAFMRVLALSAQRRSEVSTMRWQDLDLDGAEPLWTLPREAVKGDRAHDVPLSPEAVAVLESAPRLGQTHVFTSGTNGGKPIVGFDTPKRKLDQAMLELLREAAAEASDDPELVTLPRWTLHDLRRTAASNMARLNFPPHVVGAVLGHSPGATQGITAIYNRYSYSDEKRAALSAWARWLDQLMSGEGDANVVPIWK